MKKYELTDETMCFNGVTLHRIKALKDFADVVDGELGGWIEKEENLSQEGNAWVAMDAKAYENAEISDNAVLTRNAIACENSSICENALVSDETVIGGYTYIYGNSEVYGESILTGNTILCGKARVVDAKVVDAKVYDNSIICDGAFVCGCIKIHGNTIIKDAKVCKKDDIIVFKNFWSSGRYFTWTRSNNKWVVGCFHGNGEELIKKAYQDSEKSGREYERVVRYVESVLADENNKKQVK